MTDKWLHAVREYECFRCTKDGQGVIVNGHRMVRQDEADAAIEALKARVKELEKESELLRMRGDMLLLRLVWPRASRPEEGER